MRPDEDTSGPDTWPLASVVRAEALRSEAAGRIRPDPARLAAGWEQRFVIEKRRAEDLARLYEESGFEVAQDPVAPELLDDECVDCRLVAQLEYVSLYTRRREGSPGHTGASATDGTTADATSAIRRSEPPAG